MPPFTWRIFARRRHHSPARPTGSRTRFRTASPCTSQHTRACSQPPTHREAHNAPCMPSVASCNNTRSLQVRHPTRPPSASPRLSEAWRTSHPCPFGRRLRRSGRFACAMPLHAQTRTHSVSFSSRRDASACGWPSYTSAATRRRGERIRGGWVSAANTQKPCVHSLPTPLESESFSFKQ